MRELTVQEIAERIVTAVHPSLLEPGPVADGVTRIGRVSTFIPDRFTRLRLPGSVTGFGVKWIDYDSAEEADDARERARVVVLAESTPEAAYDALRRWHESE